jgi:hypothetical protein
VAEKWIDVADKSDYLSGGGMTIPLQPGQGIRFRVTNAPHTVTLDRIEGDRVTFTLRSTPQTHSLRIGETGHYDVNEDGQPDITATLVSITDNIANIAFANIPSPTTTTSENALTPIAQPSEKISAPLLVATVGLVIIVIGVIGLILKNRHSAK